jgi:hypothetical protein
MSRYTRSVGLLYRRTASVLLVAILGSGSAVASVCQAFCSDPLPTTAVESKANEPHHHAMPDEGATDSGGEADTSHQQHRSPATTAAPPGVELHAGTEVSVRDCCDRLVQRTSAAAVRADATLIPSLHAAILVSTAFSSPTDRQPSGQTRGSPPGGPSSVRTPTVLRI